MQIKMSLYLRAFEFNCMSFLSFSSKVFLLDWLLGDDEKKKTVAPPKHTYDYGRGNDYLDNVHSLESRIGELERQ